MAGRRPVGGHALVNGSGGDVDVRELRRIRNRIREASGFPCCRSLPLGNRRRRPRRRTDAQNTATATDGTDSTAANAPAARTATVAATAAATRSGRRLRLRLRLPRLRHVILFVLVEAACFLVPFLIQLIEDRLSRLLTLGIALALERCQIRRAVGIHNRSVTINSKSQRRVLLSLGII
jgi:hypothetical protein